MNVSTPCPMRGPGWATGLIGQEMAMDELAEALQLDPIELRLRNYAERDPTKDLPWSSKALRECYRQGAERFGWSRRAAEPRAMRRRARAGRVRHGDRDLPRRPLPDLRVRDAVRGRDRHRALRHHRHGAGHLHLGDAGRGRRARPAGGTGAVRARRFDLPAAKEHGGSTTMASVGSAVQAACAALRSKLAALGQGRND